MKGDCKNCVLEWVQLTFLSNSSKREFVCLFDAVEMVGYLLVRSSCWNRERPNKRIAKLVYCIVVLENFVD
jgi:hypothetical protein